MDRCLEKPQKRYHFGFPGPSKSCFGEDLGTYLGSLGMSWAVLASLGRIRGVLRARLGASEGVLEMSWGHPWASLEDLGGVWDNLGGFLKAFFGILRDFLRF